MKKISDFLEKFKSFGQKEKEEKEEFIKIVRSVLGFDLKTENIEIKDLKIRIKVFGAKRTEIVLNKNRLLETLNSERVLKYLDIN